MTTYSCIAIDDDELFLMNLEAFFEEIPSHKLLGTFANAVQGATAVIRELPDFLLIDLEMPYMDGYSLLDWILPRLKELAKQPKIIVISGNDQMMDLSKNEVFLHLRKDLLRTPGDLHKALQKASKASE